MDMNFDSLKEAWNSEQGPSKQFSQNDLKLKESHSCIDKIKKNIRVEFYFSLIFLIALAVSLPFLGLNDNQISTCAIASSLILAVAVFYFIRFFTFYKRSITLSYNTRDNLMWFYYEMKLNIEMYRSYYLLTFFMILFASTQLNFDKPPYLSTLAKVVSSKSIFFKIALFLLFAVVYMLGMEYWLNNFYGKYIKKIKSILNELKEE